MKRVKSCGCGAKPGKKIILNTEAHVGIITEIRNNGVFLNNKALYLRNNYCPECGAKYKEE